MLGAIVGDIVGSRFEHGNDRTRDFVLFTPDCRFTDDTVLTLAACKSLLQYSAEALDMAALAQRAAQNYRLFAGIWYRLTYGSRFNLWRLGLVDEPVESCGNGCAMRVSPCAYAGRTLDEVERLAEALTCVTHAHPDSLAAARTVAGATFLARRGAGREDIRRYILASYDAFAELEAGGNFTLEALRIDYFRGRALNTCRMSVPQALLCFFEADSFEETLRNAVSLGGDSDTLAAIAAGIAGAYWGVPEDIARTAEDFLDEELSVLLRTFEAQFPISRLETSFRQPAPFATSSQHDGNEKRRIAAESAS